MSRAMYRSPAGVNVALSRQLRAPRGRAPSRRGRCSESTSDPVLRQKRDTARTDHCGIIGPDGDFAKGMALRGHCMT